MLDVGQRKTQGWNRCCGFDVRCVLTGRELKRVPAETLSALAGGSPESAGSRRRRQSCRNALAGFTPATRQAGIAQASSAMTSSSAAMPA